MPRAHSNEWPTDPVAAVGHPDPSAYYEALVAAGPHRDQALGAWVVASPADVEDVLNHPAAAVRPAGATVPPHLVGTTAGALFGRLVRMRDDIGRQVARDAIVTVFQALSAPDAVQICVDVVTGLRSRLPGQLEGGVVDDWLRQVPIAVVAQLVGVTSATLDEMVDAARALAVCFAPGAPVDSVGPASAAADMLQHAVARSPVAQLLVAAAGEPDGVANAAGLFFQAFDSTAGLIGSTLVHLAVDPSRPIDELVANVLRADPPVHNTRRFIAADAAIAGVEMRQGDEVVVVLRTAPFGAGRHLCPARAIVPIIATHAVRALVDHAAGRPLPAPTGVHPSKNVRITLFS